jgi:hypothetical protein
MTLVKQAMMALLGAALLVGALLVWYYLTGRITLFIEQALCSSASVAEPCRLRGASFFLLWTVIGLVNIVLIGLLIDRLNDRLQRRR